MMFLKRPFGKNTVLQVFFFLNLFLLGSNRQLVSGMAVHTHQRPTWTDK